MAIAEYLYILVKLPPAPKGNGLRQVQAIPNLWKEQTMVLMLLIPDPEKLGEWGELFSFILFYVFWNSTQSMYCIKKETQNHSNYKKFL